MVGLTGPALRSIVGEARARGRKGNLGVEDKRLAFGANLSERGVRPPGGPAVAVKAPCQLAWLLPDY